jgi:signal transduction histidine kinase
MSLAVSLYCIFCAGLYSASTPEVGVQWQRGQLVALALITIAFAWFISLYTSWVNRPILYVLTGFFVLAGLAQIISPTELTWTLNPPSIKEIALPFGLHVTYYEATPGLLTNIHSVGGLLAAAYVLWGAVRFWLKQRSWESSRLLLALALFVLTALNDTAVSSGLYRFIYLIEYGYLAVVLLMTYFMSSAILEAASVKDTLYQRQLELESLLDTSGDLLSVLDLQTLLSLIARRALTLLKADEATIFRLEEDGVTLRPVVAYGEYIEQVMAHRLRVGEGITGHSVAQKEPLLVNYASRDPRAVNIPGTPVDEDEHVMVAPLIVRGRTIGAMLITRLRKQPFEPENLRLLVGLARLAAVAIENARLYEESQHHAAELADKVAERTAELNEANEHLRILSRIKDEFVSNVSHELRTPVANIKLYLHLLSVRPERSKEYLQTLQNEVGRLESLVESILKVSRLDQGTIQVNLVLVDLNQVVASFVSDRQMLAEQAGLSLTFEAGQASAYTYVDRLMLDELIGVLLTNALNYTPAGGQVVVRVLSGVPEHPGWVGLSVSDTGPGIPPSEMSRIFERFYRGEAGLISGKAGTGLGLSIAKEIIEHFHGTIEVASEGVPGKGTTFTVWLPAANLEEKEGA